MESKNRAVLVSKYGMLISLAFIFSYVESLIPVPVPVPGMKLGLANLVIIVGLYTIGVRGTVIISMIRIVLVGFTFGNVLSMAYSLAGGGISLIMMILCKKSSRFSQIGVSVIGGVFHNVGQITLAAFIVKTAGVFSYLPALLVAGVVAGGVIGLLAGIIVGRIQRITRIL